MKLNEMLGIRQIAMNPAITIQLPLLGVFEYEAYSETSLGSPFDERVSFLTPPRLLELGEDGKNFPI